MRTNVDEARLVEVALERAYVMEAARWDSVICRGLIEDTLPALLAEVSVLRQLLREYGHHTADCPAFDPPPDMPGFACECGWQEAAAGLGDDDPPAVPPSTAQADQHYPVGADQGAPRRRPGERDD